MTARSNRSLSENRGVGVLFSVRTLLNREIIAQSGGFVKGKERFFCDSLRKKACFRGDMPFITSNGDAR
jgi:hypothetical protein